MANSAQHMEYADELALGSMDKRLWLPTTVKEIEALGWDRPDVILFSGDAYIDHPSFGAAVIGRTLQAAGYRVAIVPQPNWQDDLRDFRKLGIPRLFFGISAGAMDSMVNHYTAARRRRADDAYTPGGRHGDLTTLQSYIRRFSKSYSRTFLSWWAALRPRFGAYLITTIGKIACVPPYYWTAKLIYWYTEWANAPSQPLPKQ